MKLYCTLSLYTEKQGGRKGSIHSGYRPNFFVKDDSQCDCVITLEDGYKLFPGQITLVHIELISPQLIENLKRVKKFFIREGRKIVGEGRVINISAS
jgi:translation elongation factor EF-Tu-like GTPase